MEFYLKIDGVDGACIRKGRERQIEIDHISWAVNQLSSNARAGAGAAVGRVSVLPVRVNAKTSTATPQLLLLCVTGQHVAHATFEAVAGEDPPQVITRLELEDVRLTGVETDGTEHEGLSDMISMDYGRIRITTFTPDPKGGQGIPITAGWDVRRGTRL